jgi:hypothetical protein
MKSSQFDEFNRKFLDLMEEYGVSDNYHLAFILIDEDDGSINAPSIANISPVPSHGVSGARAAGFLAEVIADTLLTLVMRYCGLDIMSGAGALRGMIEEMRDKHLLAKQAELRHQRTRPEA